MLTRVAPPTAVARRLWAAARPRRGAGGRVGGLPRSLAAGCVVGALLACGTEFGRMALDRNRHVIVPGRAYRSGQLSPDQLDRYVRRHGIRTVVNLRGRPFDAWYLAQARVTQSIGIGQEDVTTSAHRLPSPGELGRLIEVFDRAEPPLLMHCQQGADRTGLAAGVYLLLKPGADYETARRQCSPRYGHVPIHAARAMDEFFDQYERWLIARAEAHSPAMFREWAAAHYCPGPARARLELVAGPTTIELGRPTVFTVRAHNQSPEPWHFKAGTGAGVHAQYLVLGPAGAHVFADRAGLFDRTVAPGEFIDLRLPVPGLTAPGRYRLFLDLAVGPSSFTQHGSEPLTHDWDARCPAGPAGR